MVERPGADSEEKHEPVSDIDTAVVDSLKALDLERPIREAVVTDPVQIVGAAAALLVGFLLGYAVRSYVSRRRRRRRATPLFPPLFLPEDSRTTTDAKPDEQSRLRVIHKR
jgi:hypothetical protein